MLFMVIERFNNRDPLPIYQRLREGNASLPNGITYISSWIEPNFDRCFQVVECNDLRLIQEWVLLWRDLISFDVVPVVSSAELRELIGRHLPPS